jgi:hypothetical protein
VPTRQAIRGAFLALSAIVVLGPLASGCGSDQDDETPAACLASSDGYLRALQSAPGEVRLGGGVAISSCLVPSQEGGQLASIGQQMIVAATKLNAEARREPGGPAALQLGYLSGAISKGADAIHADLVRRINSAAQFSAGGAALPVSFERAYSRGYSAGRESG